MKNVILAALVHYFTFLLRQHETILDLLVETVPQIKGFWRDVVNFGVVMLLTDSSTSWHRSSNKHCQISSLHCVDYVPFKTPVALQHATFWRTHRAAEFVFPSEQNLSGPVWTKKRMTCGFGSVTSADVMLSGSFRENIQFKNQQLVICPLNLSYKISLFFSNLISVCAERWSSTLHTSLIRLKTEVLTV